MRAVEVDASLSSSHVKVKVATLHGHEAPIQANSGRDIVVFVEQLYMLLGRRAVTN